ncbi:MAG: hybrid sensor histidine kinase/response regulator [Opitutales bacterium]|nr:hybrid sensor histidine kinase/response regulator [Opitutales bacterium]
MEPPNNKNQRKILIVDDIAFNRTVLQKILSKSGYELFIATSGEQALEVVELKFPDLILLDYMMPGMNGLEVLKLLKADPRFSRIPVMFLTASDEMEYMTEAFDCGAVDYITKPFKAAELNARVSTQIRSLNDAAEILKRVQEQQELIHILAHDLRNPLVACRTLVELIEEGDGAPEVIGPKVRESMQKCLDTIELVRKKGLLEEDVTRLELESLDLLKQIKGALHGFEDMLIQKGLVLENKVPEGIGVIAESTSLIHVVISNLISNAIKFSYPNSKIEISSNDNSEHIELAIKDYGMGIPQNLMPIIFDPKKVTRRAGTLNEQGTGYGMGLVKKLVRVYGGDIRIESVAKSADNRNHGTTVFVSLRKDS